MNAMIYTDDGIVWRHVQSVAQLLRECPWAQRYVLQEGSDPSNKSPVRIQNACGTIYVEDRYPTHCAWRRGGSIFGMVRKAYTMAGNFILQGEKLTFKGAADPASVQRIASTLVRGQFDVRIQLVVLSVGIHRCVDVAMQGMLERCMGRYRWVRVMNRIEEICSVVIFYVQNWRQMESELGVEPWAVPPKSCTVSVTKRGTMTVRLTWQGTTWEDNRPYEHITRVLARFVRDNI